MIALASIHSIFKIEDMSIVKDVEIRRILIKVGSGCATEDNLTSLMELLNKQPAPVPEVIGVLAGILKKEDTKAYSSAIMALNMVAEKEPELVAGSLNAIIGGIGRDDKEFYEDRFLGSLDILIKISQKYPDKMEIAISNLLMCLENISAAVREKAYFLLALLAIMKPGFFRGHSKELVRILNGLNIDERIYACRLIMKIAERDPKIVESTYHVLEDLSLNHLDSNLRAEAAYALEKLKVEKNIVKQESSRGTVDLAKSGEDKTPPLVKANKVTSKKRKKIKTRYHAKEGFKALDIPYSELANLIVPSEKDMKDMLTEFGLNHLIVKKIEN